MKPGIYENVSLADYHAAPGLSSSVLKELLKSGAHYKASLKEEREQSTEMRLGTLVHCMLLEPEKVNLQVHVGEYNVRRGKDWEIAKQDGEGKLICNREEYDRAQEIAEAFRVQATSHPYFNGEKFKLLEGLKENSFFASCPKSGLLLKARPDNITANGVIVDFKTTSDASVDEFQRSIVKYGYYLSAAHYLNVVTEALKQFPHRSIPVAPRAFVMIALETKAPYGFQVYFFSADALNAGRMHADKAMQTFKQCSETGIWEAYKKEMVEIGLPNWFYYKYPETKE